MSLRIGSVNVSTMKRKEGEVVDTHSKLIHKLFSYGIRGNLLFWVKAFLSN